MTQSSDGFPITGRIRNMGVLFDVTDIPGKLSRKESCGSPPERWTELECVIRQDADIKLIGLIFQEKLRGNDFLHQFRLSNSGSKDVNPSQTTCRSSNQES